MCSFTLLWVFGLRILPFFLILGLNMSYLNHPWILSHIFFPYAMTFSLLIASLVLMEIPTKDIVREIWTVVDDYKLMLNTCNI